jgi:hypothetical protein
MIPAIVILGQCVIVTPSPTTDQVEPPWQGRVVSRTDDGYGVAPVDRPSITVVVPTERVASCGPEAARATAVGPSARLPSSWAR